MSNYASKSTDLHKEMKHMQERITMYNHGIGGVRSQYCHILSESLVKELSGVGYELHF